LMSAGQDVRIRVTLRSAATAEAVDALDALIGPFVLLASSGALAGERIDPSTSTIDDKEGPFVHEGSVDWLLRSCRVDERSITVLGQMFLSVQDICPVARVLVSGTRTRGTDQLAVVNITSINPYPLPFATPDFSVERDSEITPDFVVRA